MEREYYKRASYGRRLSDYPLEAEFEFPKYIYVAYAVCIPACGSAYFIADGESQICERCGGEMFRTLVRRYRRCEKVVEKLFGPITSVQLRYWNHSNAFLLDEEHGAANRKLEIPISPPIRDYWKIASFNRKVSGYPDIRSVKFPPGIGIGYAVCVNECGVRSEVVDNGPQICNRCGGMMLCIAVVGYKRTKKST